jgi:hypothetical protein
MRQTIRMLALGAALALATAATAGTAFDDLLTAEHEVLGGGGSSFWKTQEIGGGSRDVGGVRAARAPGTGHTGTTLKAAALSLLLPGAGQLYNGDRDRALLFAGAEAAVWTGYLVFLSQAHGLEDDYREYAGFFAGVDGEYTERYWRAVGRYMDSDEYNEDLLMAARAEDVEAAGLIAPADAWFWRSEQHRDNYKSLRADATRAYDRRDFMILFAIVNRAVSVYDAVRRAGPSDHLATVAGLDFDIESRPTAGGRGTACVFSASF